MIIITISNTTFVITQTTTFINLANNEQSWLFSLHKYFFL